MKNIDKTDKMLTRKNLAKLSNKPSSDRLGSKPIYLFIFNLVSFKYFKIFFKDVNVLKLSLVFSFHQN
jgi:hypothetical protein